MNKNEKKKCKFLIKHIIKPKDTVKRAKKCYLKISIKK